MLKVDAALPILLDPDGTGSAYTLLRAAMMSHAGRRRLWMACGCDPEPEIATGRILQATVAIPGAMWRGNVVTIETTLPDTIVASLPGRWATDVMDHPALKGRVIAEAHNAQGTCMTLRPQTVALRDLGGVTAWRRALTTLTVAGDLVDTFRTRNRLRSMARRGEAIEASRLDTCDAGFDMTIFLMSMTSMMLAWAVACFMQGLNDPKWQIPVSTVACVIGVIAAVSAAITWRLSFEFSVSDDAVIMPPWLKRNQ